MVSMTRTISGFTSMKIVDSKHVIEHLSDGWVRTASKSIPSPTSMGSLDNNSVRMNGMIYFTNILRNSTVVDLDDLIDVPSYIFN